MPTKKPTPTAKQKNSKPAATKLKAVAVTTPMKPTKWGVDLLVKLEAFRKALAAQK